jgi:hypothetical protein
MSGFTGKKNPKDDDEEDVDVEPDEDEEEEEEGEDEAEDPNTMKALMTGKYVRNLCSDKFHFLVLTLIFFSRIQKGKMMMMTLKTKMRVMKLRGKVTMMKTRKEMMMQTSTKKEEEETMMRKMRTKTMKAQNLKKKLENEKLLRKHMIKMRKPSVKKSDNIIVSFKPFLLRVLKTKNIFPENSFSYIFGSLMFVFISVV